MFISMSEGIARLIGKVAEFAQVDPANIVLLPVVKPRLDAECELVLLICKDDRIMRYHVQRSAP